MTLLPEPPYSHGATRPPQTAVLLCNLGTPDEPTPPAVRRYLAEFLSDPRVVEIPRLLWWLILHGIILRVRPAKSAAKYARIWTADGSPLKVWTREAGAAAGRLPRPARPPRSPCATRCATASRRSASVLDELKAAGVDARAGAAAVPAVLRRRRRRASVDAVAAWAQRTRAPARAALRQPLPRRPRLHRRAGASACPTTGWSTAAPTGW